MNKYRVFFEPLIGECETVSLMAIDRDDAIKNAIDIAQDPDSQYNADSCTFWDVCGVMVLIDGEWTDAHHTEAQRSNYRSLGFCVVSYILANLYFLIMTSYSLSTFNI